MPKVRQKGRKINLTLKFQKIIFRLHNIKITSKTTDVDRHKQTLIKKANTPDYLMMSKIGLYYGSIIQLFLF